MKFPSLFCCYHFCFVLCSYQSERHGRTGAVEERSAAAAAAVVRTTPLEVIPSFFYSCPQNTQTQKNKQTQQESEEATVSPSQSLNNIPGDLSETCCTIAPLLSLLLTIVIAYLLSTVIMNLQSFIGKPSKKNMSILRSGCVKLMQKTLLFLTALSIASNATWCNLSNIQNAKPNILYLASPVSR